MNYQIAPKNEESHPRITKTSKDLYKYGKTNTDTSRNIRAYSAS